MFGSTVRVLSLALLAFSPLAVAGEPVAEAANPPDAVVDTPVATEGMRVYIDPETGLRTSTPTEEQLRAIELDPTNAASSAPRVLIEQRMPSGALMLTTPGGFQTTMEAHAGPDGRVTFECNDATHAHAAAALHHHTAAPARDVR